MSRKSRKLISICLFPFTIWYAVGIAIRNFMFVIGLKKQTAPRVTTISVGNLNMGGSGKTPLVDFILSTLSPLHPTALVSRGYGRHSKGCVIAEGLPDPRQIGDEPAMLATKHPEVTVCVSERRLIGINRLLQRENPPQLVVLDDAYQHRYVKPAINILCTEYDHPFTADNILPFGNLREFRSAKRRANIVIVTKSPKSLPPITKQNLIADLNLMPYQRVYFSYLEYGNPYPLGSSALDGKPQGYLSDMDQILAFTGIAHPASLISYLKSKSTTTHLSFADHHEYTTRDIQRVIDSFNKLPGNNKCIITTEKDAIRLNENLRGLLQGVPVLVQPIEMRFHDTNSINFEQSIKSSVAENITFRGRLSTTKLNQYFHR